MAFVSSHQSVAEVKRGAADEEIGERDHQSLSAGLGIDLRDDVADVAGKVKGSAGTAAKTVSR